MNLHLFPFLLALHVCTISALNVQFKQVKRALLLPRSQTSAVSVTRPAASLKQGSVLAAGGVNGGNGLDINSVRDLIYIANITVGGTPYALQLDTGSSDLWIKGDTSPLPNTEQTSITYNLTYGIGWTFGHVAFAPTVFAGISVPKQALIDAASAQNPALGFGASGILGLGFTSLSSIDALLNQTNASSGRSLLYNLFAANRSQPNFIAFSLQRSSDPNADVQGSFSIGEYVPKYAGVANTPAIPTWPTRSPSRWTVLLDSFIVHGQTISVTGQVSGAPSDKAVVLLDSGTSYTYAPVEVCDAIYKDVPGAHFDASLGQWVVPCDARIDMAIQIGGRIFPLHPLDISPHGISNPSVCVGSFIPQAVAVGQGQFDWLVGDSVLRSIYSIYDFGDFDASGNMGDPYIKLFPIIDPNAAAHDFHSTRGGTFDGNITYNASNSTSSGKTNLSLSDDAAASLARLGQYFPIMLGVMGLNVLLLITLIIVGVLLLCGCKGQLSKAVGFAKRRQTRGRTDRTPMHEGAGSDISASNGEELPPPIHAYQPVSMAMTEDTMVPFASSRKSRKFDVESLAPVSPNNDQRMRTTSLATVPPEIRGKASSVRSETYEFNPPNADFVNVALQDVPLEPALCANSDQEPTVPIQVNDAVPLTEKASGQAHISGNPEAHSPTPSLRESRRRTNLFSVPPIDISRRASSVHSKNYAFSPTTPASDDQFSAVQEVPMRPLINVGEPTPPAAQKLMPEDSNLVNAGLNSTAGSLGISSPSEMRHTSMQPRSSGSLKRASAITYSFTPPIQNFNHLQAPSEGVPPSPTISVTSSDESAAQVPVPHSPSLAMPSPLPVDRNSSAEFAVRRSSASPSQRMSSRPPSRNSRATPEFPPRSPTISITGSTESTAQPHSYRQEAMVPLESMAAYPNISPAGRDSPTSSLASSSSRDNRRKSLLPGTPAVPGRISAESSQSHALPQQGSERMPMGPGGEPHSPVRMAATIPLASREDIVPPVPARPSRNWAGPPSSGMPSNRLRAKGPPVDPSRRASAAPEDYGLTPPSPGFRMVDGDRPRSMA